MKKILLALAIFAVATSATYAAIGINWMNGYGVYDHDALDLESTDEADSILSDYTVTWQLIYAGDNDLIDAPDASNGVNGYVGGDDDVWATRIITAVDTDAGDGTEWDTWLLAGAGSGPTTYVDMSWNTAGFVYQRIYENPIGVGAYYFDSGLQALDLGYTGAPVDFQADGGVAIQPDQQVGGAPIPEPATMALLGLGALTMAIRRRRA